MKDQTAGNYQYDAIGNLKSSVFRGTDNIKWNVYGKVEEVTKQSITTATSRMLHNYYDPSGNRVGQAQQFGTGGAATYDYVWTVRDAQGNAMAVYKVTGASSASAGTLKLIEHHMYGSSRLGIIKRNVSMDTDKLTPVHEDDLGNTYLVNFTRGEKLFEVSNHLGNVVTIVSDKRLPVAGSGSPTPVSFYNAEMLYAADYTPFGMTMNGRNYNTPSEGYRYGFNGKEYDNELKGDGNGIDYGFRMYDAQIGRFWTVDPLTKSYPWYTPYQFAGNTPIQAIDLDGLEELKSIYFKNVRFVVLKNVTFDFVIRNSTNTLTTEMMGKDATGRTEYSVNLQMYEPKPGTNPDYYTATKPQADYRSQGLNNAGGKKVEGRSSPSTFFFSIGNNGAVTTGMGDAPLDSKISFGGGVPLYVNGLKYGEDNIWKAGTPAEIAKNTRGAVAPENTKYLSQKSNSAYPGQNDDDQGKTILAYNSKQNIWLVASQEDGKTGMTLDRIRDKLVNEGWDQILSFDGSSSATLVKDNQVLTKPANYKNNTAPSGLSLSVPNK